MDNNLLDWIARFTLISVWHTSIIEIAHFGCVYSCDLYLCYMHCNKIQTSNFVTVFHSFWGVFYKKMSSLYSSDLMFKSIDSLCFLFAFGLYVRRHIARAIYCSANLHVEWIRTLFAMQCALVQNFWKWSATLP